MARTQIQILSSTIVAGDSEGRLLRFSIMDNKALPRLVAVLLAAENLDLAKPGIRDLEGISIDIVEEPQQPATKGGRYASRSRTTDA